MLYGYICKSCPNRQINENKNNPSPSASRHAVSAHDGNADGEEAHGQNRESRSFADRNVLQSRHLVGRARHGLDPCGQRLLHGLDDDAPHARRSHHALTRPCQLADGGLSLRQTH